MIKIENVTKTFDGFTALDNFSLEISKGSAYGLLGSNGAGKSTLLRLISGIYRHDSGTITIDGEQIYDNVKLKQNLYFVSDDTVQFSNMKLGDMQTLVKTFYPKYSEEKFNKLQEVLQLPTDKKLSAFSKGMRRQAAVMCALASGCDYLLFDEAFDGLDPTMRIVVKKMMIDAMVENDATIVISSHNLKEIEEFCDTAGLLHQGKLVFNRELDSLKGDIHKVQTSFEKEGSVSKDDFPQLEILHIRQSGSVINMIVRGDGGQTEAVLTERGAYFCDIMPLTLEEIFLYEMEVLGYDFSGIDR
ncbi:MAG: ABC transporter ATP-binding protein [Eubacterium sp.]|nr:ABC transporter ATP-binding protein [Eubacterium sp.]